MDQTLDRNFNKANDKMNTVGRDAKNALSETVNKMADSAKNIEIPAAVTEQLRVLKEQSQVVLDRTEDMVKKHPFYAVLGAAAVGAIVASLVSSALSSRNYRN